MVWKDRILLCGGEGTSVIEEYNPDTDTWSEWKPQLPKAADDSLATFTCEPNLEMCYVIAQCKPNCVE